MTHETTVDVPIPSSAGGRWARLLAEVALDLSGDELTAFLDHTVRDQALRHEVEALVSADREAAEFLESPALGVSPAWAAEPDWLLRRGTLGPFRLVRCLGKGGMGVVFLAERPGEDTPVALKVTWSTPSLVARLASEGRILSRLRHPGIAAVLDVGTAEGIPYVALEYVQGTPIDQHFATAPWRVVVETFLDICDAVEYAHRNLVVHRDLKPAHILIDATGHPKLLDFGIAKLLEDSGAAAETSTMTRLGGSPVTPSFASPEQLRGEPVTTASDVYSLGVVLYKTLTGQLPRNIPSLRAKDLQEVFASPPQTASAAALLAPGEKSSERLGDADFSRDLDAVVLKALRPETDARYRTVAELREELGNCLSGAPVAARRFSPLYRATRTLRRHRGLVAVISSLFLFLTAFGIRESMQSQRLAEERDRAERERAQAQQVTNFVVDLLRQTAPGAAGPVTESVDQILVRGSERLEAAQDLGPGAREELLATLGEMNLKRRYHLGAGNQLQEAVDLRIARLGDQVPEVADLLLLLAQVELQKANLGAAEKQVRAVLDLRRSFQPVDPIAVAECLRLLSRISAQQMWPAKTQEAAQEAITIWTDQPGDFAPEISAVEADLALVLRMQGDWQEAARLLRASLERLQRSAQPTHLLETFLAEDLAATLIGSGRDLEEAEKLLRESLAVRSEAYGPNSPTTAKTRQRLGQLYLARRDLVQAHQELTWSLDVARSARDFDVVGESLLFLGETQRRQGDLAAAERSLLECEKLIDGVFRADHPYRLFPILELAEVALLRQDLEGAAQYLHRGDTICDANPEFHWCIDLQILEGRTLLAQGEKAAGQKLLAEDHAHLLATLGPDHPRTREAARFLQEDASPVS